MDGEIRDLFRSQNGLYTGKGLCLNHIDFHHFRMGMRASKDLYIEHAWKIDIRGIFGLPDQSFKGIYLSTRLPMTLNSFAMFCLP